MKKDELKSIIENIYKVKVTPQIEAELDYQPTCKEERKYLYMGMALLGNRKVNISTGYTIQYCIKKAIQFAQEDKNFRFTNINKYELGDTEEIDKFFIWEI
jgi:hypothetical protein